MSNTRRGWALILLLWLTAALMALSELHRQGGFSALFGTTSPSSSAIILRSMWFPRQGMALLTGATLGVCGWLMQRALRNPLAEPITLGMTAGATLAMGLASLWFPALLASAALPWR